MFVSIYSLTPSISKIKEAGLRDSALRSLDVVVLCDQLFRQDINRFWTRLGVVQWFVFWLGHL